MGLLFCLSSGSSFYNSISVQQKSCACMCMCVCVYMHTRSDGINSVAPLFSSPRGHNATSKGNRDFTAQESSDRATKNCMWMLCQMLEPHYTAQPRVDFSRVSVTASFVIYFREDTAQPKVHQKASSRLKKAGQGRSRSVFPVEEESWFLGHLLTPPQAGGGVGGAPVPSPTRCIWKDEASQISDKSLPLPGPRRLHRCTQPASWPEGSTAPSCDSSRARTGASRTRRRWSGPRRRCSARTPCVRSPAARAGGTQPGAASERGLGLRKHSTHK